MKLFCVLTLAFLAVPTALASPVVSCHLEDVIAPGRFVNKSVDRPILLNAGVNELTYADFGDPQGVWQTRRVYLVLALRETSVGLELGVGIPEEHADYSVDHFTPGLTAPFTSRSLRPFAGVVRCEPTEPTEPSYLFVHSRSANLALRARPFTVDSFDAADVLARTGAEIRTLDALLGQSCLLGSSRDAFEALRASAIFSRRDTLSLESEGLSFRVDRYAGCRKHNDDDDYCVDPIIEKNGQKIQIPRCPGSKLAR